MIVHFGSCLRQSNLKLWRFALLTANGNIKQHQNVRTIQVYVPYYNRSFEWFDVVYILYKIPFIYIIQCIFDFLMYILFIYMYIRHFLHWMLRLFLGIYRMMMYTYTYIMSISSTWNLKTTSSKFFWSVLVPMPKSSKSSKSGKSGKRCKEPPWLVIVQSTAVWRVLLNCS